MTETFCKLTHEIMRATHWISRTTGQHFKLTATQKIIWVHMVSRYEFFRSLGKEWFDDQEEIARETGCDVSTVKEFIKLLARHGYMVVERKKLRGFVSSNSYKILAPLQLYNKHTSPVALESVAGGVEDACLDRGCLASSEPTAAPQEVVEQLVPVFEDIPLGAHSDKPPKAPVVVLETLQSPVSSLADARGFAAELDGVTVQYIPPVLLPGHTATYEGDAIPPW
ncbi:DUF6945 domain-containing protein [Pseudomonas fluorescens]|uniref:DUF6945 domain-containing protein n=1 Tax=Pseudomonas fluorescens TaxID=294 RepID=UPI00381E9BB5